MGTEEMGGFHSRMQTLPYEDVVTPSTLEKTFGEVRSPEGELGIAILCGVL